MKKTFLTVGIALSICSFTSCSNEDMANTKSLTNSLSVETTCESLHAINLKIDSINTVQFGIPSFYDSEPGSKVIFKKSIWAKLVDGFKSVLKADAEGAATETIAETVSGETPDWTNVIGRAVTSSLIKAISVITSKELEVVTRGTDDTRITNDSLLDDYVQHDPLEYTDGLTGMDSIGIYHNRIITRLFNEHNTIMYWQKATTRNILGEVNRVAEQEIGLPVGRLSQNDSLNEKIIQHIDFIREQTPEMEELYYNDVKKDNPRLYKTIEIICNYINGLIETDDAQDAIGYYNEIMNTIDESDVDENSKVSLRLSLNVAFSSANLWNKAAFTPIQ